MKYEKFEALKQFLSGYFHEDWALEAVTPDDVVMQYLATHPTNIRIQCLAAQINQYVDSKHDDATIEHGLFEELGCYYLPSADGMSPRVWLLHVADLLRKY